MSEKQVFDVLSVIDVNEHKENKNGLSYLSWVWAWSEVVKRYPDAYYEVKKFDGLPYVYDENTGYMVYTTVTISGKTLEMWLPVMDFNNKAMKSHQYEYTTGYGKNQKSHIVEQATMFDVNKAIMRCLAKNLAMFGLGLYIYAGEDLPPEDVNKYLEEVVKLQVELNELGINFRGKEDETKEDSFDYNAWILKNGGLETQDVGKLESINDMKSLIKVYRKIIEKKKKSEEKE